MVEGEEYDEKAGMELPAERHANVSMKVVCADIIIIARNKSPPWAAMLFPALLCALLLANRYGTQKALPAW